MAANPTSRSYTVATGADLWAGVSAPAEAPAWLTSLAVGQGAHISGTQWGSIALSGRGYPMNYSGGAVDTARNMLYIWGGGRADCSDNSVTRIDLTADSPSWERVEPASATGTITSGAPTNSDGRPNSRHSYALCVINPVTGALHVCGGAGMHNASSNTGQHDIWTEGVGWTTAAAFPLGANESAAWADVDGNIYVCNQSANAPVGALYKWTRSTNTVSTVTDIGNPASPGEWAADLVHNRAFKLPDSAIGAREFDMTTGAVSSVTISGAALPASASICYDSANDLYWVRGWADGGLYQVVRDSSTAYTATAYTPAGVAPGGSTGAARAAPYVNGYNRFVYMPSLGVLAWVRDYMYDVWVMRTS